jgi:ABC-2 type transport system ATP-binding protein
MTHSGIMLKISNLTKYFYPSIPIKQLLRLDFSKPQPVKALNNVSFDLQKGSVLGILGLNGAGKTTLLKVISSLVLPDSGSVIVGGLDPEKDDLQIKAMLGLVSSEERSFYWRLTGRQNLELFACLHGLSKNDSQKKIGELFQTFGITYADKRFDSYSTGMKRKFELMRALLHSPDLLLLDEPTKSLDLRSSMELRGSIKLMRKENKTIVIATHDIQEAKDLCDTFLILKEGTVYGFGTLEELRRSFSMPGAGIEDIYRNVVTT